MGEPNRNSTNRSGNPRSTPAYDAPPRAISACSPPWNTTTLNLYSVAVEALQGKRTLGETATPVPGLWICKVFGVIYDPEVGDSGLGRRRQHRRPIDSRRLVRPDLRHLQGQLHPLPIRRNCRRLIWAQEAIALHKQSRPKL